MKLPDFQVRDACEDCRLSECRRGMPEVCILGTNDWISGEFGALSQWFQEAMYPDEKTGRGRSRSPRPHCAQAGLWSRVESWLNAVTKEGVKAGKAACQSVLEQLTFSADPDNTPQLRAELFSHLTCQGPISEETD